MNSATLELAAVETADRAEEDPPICTLTPPLHASAGFGWNGARPGGYIPIVSGLAILTVMVVWNFGQTMLSVQQLTTLPSWDRVVEIIDSKRIARKPGSAVLLASSAQEVPQSLANHLSLLHSLPELARVVTIQTVGIPTVAEGDRFFVSPMSDDIDRIVIRCGFMEPPDLPQLMWEVEAAFPQLQVLPSTTVYFLSDRTFIAGDSGELRRLTETIYSKLHRNAASPTACFNLPTERVVTLGTQVDL